MISLQTSSVAEEDFIPISALQHMLYCPRQCALIHIERQWEENAYTAEGRVLHRRVKEKTTLGLMPFVRAALLARRLRDDLDGYPPFVWR